MYRLCIFLLPIFILIQPLQAQPSLDIKKTEVNYPKTRVYFKVGCNGSNKNDFQGQNFELYENGKLVKSALLHCFDEPDCCVSAVLVLDRSGSMLGQRFINMRLGATNFINEMNPDGQLCDEAAIVSFASTVRLDVPMTSNKDTLLAGLNLLVPSGSTALWDGVARGIQELLGSAKNTCQAIIVLSDGGDNGSRLHNLNSVVQMALGNSFRIYTIGLGGGADVNLPQLAQRTGGRHFTSVTGSDLAEIYSSIREGILGWSFPWCYLEYDIDCADGTERELELVLKNYCGGTVSRTVRYTVPYLPETYKKTDIRIGEVEAPALSEVLVPVYLDTRVSGMFGKSFIDILYENEWLDYLGISPGPLLQGKRLTAQANNGAITVRLEEDVELTNAAGVLFYLRFRTKDPPVDRSTPLQIVHWGFEKYCLEPVLRNGSVLIHARSVFLFCRTSNSVVLRRDENSGGYEPRVFDVTVTVTNSGSKEAEHVQVELLADASRIHLVNPSEYVQGTTPATILPAGSATATWTVAIAGYKDISTFPIRFRIIIDDFLHHECELDVSFDSPRSDFMHCRIDAPDQLKWNVLDRRYENNPFPVIVTAFNSSNLTVHNARATLTISSSGIRLLTPTEKEQALTPGDIPPGAQGNAQWIVEALVGEMPRTVTLNITIEADNMPTIECKRILELDPGISPRLDCNISMTDSVIWSETLRRYIPNPFDITVTVPNFGNEAAENVTATLQYDARVLRLLNPVSDRQGVTPSKIPKGSQGSATWQVEVLPQAKNSVVHIDVLVEADNHIPITCSNVFHVDSVLTADLACELHAPDTIYFRDQYYDPEECDISLRVRNTGNSVIRDVRSQLLQDTRFTILSSASLFLADELHPQSDATGEFRVRIHPRSTDGYDTIRVNIQGENTDPVWCYRAIWVQRIRMPLFELACALDSDTPVFDPERDDYVPNPLTVSTTLINSGETWAEDCQIMLVGQTLLTPIGNTLRGIGTMQVNDTRHDTWSVRVLPHTTSTWDTLTFQVLGRGGLGKQLVFAECRLPLFIPATLQTTYTVQCTAPDTLYFRNGSYQPDPILFTTRIHNSGNREGNDIRVRLMLPTGVFPADGETPERVITRLQAGDEETLSWRLHVEERQHDGDYDFCLAIVDASGSQAQCCTAVRIWRSSLTEMEASCLSIDTLYIDKVQGGYQGNPFEVKVVLRSTGSEEIRDVYATLIVPGELATVLDPVQHSLGDLTHNAVVEHSWRVQAVRQLRAVDLPLLIEITASNLSPARSTTCLVHLSADPEPSLQTYCTVVPADTLHFDENTGRYTASDVYLTMYLRNDGDAEASAVQAYVFTPETMVLATGESTIKSLPAHSLPPGGKDSISWRFTPIFSETSGPRDFRAVVTCNNGASAECFSQLYVFGTKKEVALSLPENSVLRYHEKQLIPVMISRTVVAQLSEYVIRISYDPSLLRINGVSTRGTLTGRHWVGASLRSKGDGIIEVSDYTTVAPLAAESGVLFNLQAEGILERGWGAGSFGETSIRFDTAFSRLNRGAISYQAIDGRAIVTDACLEPLMATDGYSLGQNRPNPFNPRTRIEYTLPENGQIRLRVFDCHGRDVAILVNEIQDAGNYSVLFDATDLPSGMYFYRLEHERGSESKKMLLLR